MTKPKIVVLILIMAVWIVATIVQFPDTIMNDFYQIWRAGRAVLAGEDPYSGEFTATLQREWPMTFAATGFVYPFPTIVVCLPFVLLPLVPATWIWAGLGVAGSFLAVFMARNCRDGVIIALLFYPLHSSIMLLQATMIWFGLCVLMVVATRRRWSWVVGLCIALLPVKPQVGLFMALAGIAWAIEQRDQIAMAWAGMFALIVWGGSFAIYPAWPGGFMEHLRIHSEIVTAGSLLPVGVVLMLVTYRIMPWYAWIPLAQVVMFPITDVYTALPLLLAWLQIGGALGMVGAGISWLWLFLDLHEMGSYWLVLIVPLIACSAYRYIQTYPAGLVRTANNNSQPKQVTNAKA